MAGKMRKVTFTVEVAEDEDLERVERTVVEFLLRDSQFNRSMGCGKPVFDFEKPLFFSVGEMHVGDPYELTKQPAKVRPNPVTDKARRARVWPTAAAAAQALEANKRSWGATCAKLTTVASGVVIQLRTGCGTWYVADGEIPAGQVRFVVP